MEQRVAGRQRSLTWLLPLSPTRPLPVSLTQVAGSKSEFDTRDLSPAWPRQIPLFLGERHCRLSTAKETWALEIPKHERKMRAAGRTRFRKRQPVLALLATIQAALAGGSASTE
jgi:hypothetical protein